MVSDHKIQNKNSLSVRDPCLGGSGPLVTRPQAEVAIAAQAVNPRGCACVASAWFWLMPLSSHQLQCAGLCNSSLHVRVLNSDTCSLTDRVAASMCLHGLVVMAWVLEPFDGGLIVVVDGGCRGLLTVGAS